MLREWVVEGGGLDGYFGEQGLPAGIQYKTDRCQSSHTSCYVALCVVDLTIK